MAQGFLQLFLLPLPTLLFRLRALFEGGAFDIDLARPLFMGPPGFLNRSLGLRDSPLAAIPLFRPGGFFLSPPAFTPLLLPLIGQCGLAGCLIACRAGRRFAGPNSMLSWPTFDLFAGEVRSASTLNGPSDPTGRLRMTPGFDMAAAITSGSSVSVAKP
ncbi:MAG: hypothetical protein ABIL01_19140 [Pseudomonadota bacterium]